MTVIAKPKHGDRISALDTFYPTELIVVGQPGYEETDATVTTFGYVMSGEARLVAPGALVGSLREGAFFSVPGDFRVDPAGLVALIKRYGYRGQMGVGMTERRGRLSYIDGCSDSLLVYPPRIGDPCLNYLHFPPGILQTQHTHPTVRMGIVARGAGKAFRVPDGGNSGWEVDLTAGCVFLLPEQEQHSFRTTETNCEMDVIAYHPDSDVGFSDANHPMRSRTYIGNAR
jgi:hypothetical protein